MISWNQSQSHLISFKRFQNLHVSWQSSRNACLWPIKYWWEGERDGFELISPRSKNIQMRLIQQPRVNLVQIIIEVMPKTFSKSKNYLCKKDYRYFVNEWQKSRMFDSNDYSWVFVVARVLCLTEALRVVVVLLHNHGIIFWPVL